jgi:hypothetical protein
MRTTDIHTPNVTRKETVMRSFPWACILGALAGTLQAVDRRGETHLGRLSALVGVGYFFVWTVFGIAVRARVLYNIAFPMAYLAPAIASLVVLL